MVNVKRVWFVSHYSMPPEYEMRIKTQKYAQYFIKKGIDCTIFSASTIHNTDINLIENDVPYLEKVYGGIRFVHVRCGGYRGSGFSRIRNMLQFTHRFSKIAGAFELPDVIIADTNCITYRKIYEFCKANGIRFIADIRDLWPLSIVEYYNLSNRNPLIQYLYHREKTMYKSAEGVIFSMEGGYDYIVDKGWKDEIPKSKIHYINNGIDLAAFNKEKREFQIEDEDLKNEKLFKVVYAGSIRKVNNIGALLDVAKQITDDRIKFLIWGAGDELPFLKKRMIDENITNVVFKGQVEKKYIPYIVSQASINYLHFEKTKLLKYGISPNKLFDYFAAGKPVLMDFETSYNLVLENKCGFVAKDTSEMVKILQNLQSVPKSDYEYLCQRSKEAALVFDYDVLSETLLQIIE